MQPSQGADIEAPLAGGSGPRVNDSPTAKTTVSSSKLPTIVNLPEPKNVEMRSLGVLASSEPEQESEGGSSKRALGTKRSFKTEKSSEVLSEKKLSQSAEAYENAVNGNHIFHRKLETKKSFIDTLLESSIMSPSPSNTSASSQSEEEISENDQSLFRPSSIMVPFNSEHFWLAFRMTMFPFFYQIFYPKMREFLPMMLSFAKAKDKAFNVVVFVFQLWQYLLVTIFCMLVFLYTSAEAKAETYSDRYMPVLQSISGVWIAPLLTLLAHRLCVGIKYATMSKQEWNALMSETHPEKIKKNGERIQLATAWQNLPDHLIKHEMDIAAARCGFKDGSMGTFYVADPLKDYSAYNNFRMWQAFLLGKNHLCGLTHELHPDLKDIMIKVVGNNNPFQAAVNKLAETQRKDHQIRHVTDSTIGDGHDITMANFKAAREKEADQAAKDAAAAVGPAIATVKSTKGKFALLAKKNQAAIDNAKEIVVTPPAHYEVNLLAVARALQKHATNVPQTKLVSRIILSCGFILAFTYSYPFFLRTLDPKLSPYIHFCTYFILAMSAIITFIFWFLTCTFISINILDSNRRYFEAICLQEMIRPNDLDLLKQVSIIGITPSQRALVPDYIDRFLDSNAKPCCQFKSSRNPEVARLPRIYIDQGGRNNFIAWGNLRMLCRNFGYRFKYRLNWFVSLNFIAVFFLFTSVFAYNMVQLHYANKLLVFEPAYRWPLVCPLNIQAMIAAIALNIGVTVYVFVSARANAAYNQHKGTLLCRLQQNEAHRCFMADMIPKEILNDKATQLEVKERLQLLHDVSACIGIIMKNIAASDPNLSIRVLGGVASVSIFSLLITYNTLWVSVFSALYSQTLAFPVQFKYLFLDANYKAIAWENAYAWQNLALQN